MWKSSNFKAIGSISCGDTDFGNACDQQQSPLFTMLPLDVRRHIYRHLWRDYGTLQHIYAFSGHSYLSHYPCLLDQDAFNHHSPPSPASREIEALAEATAEAGVPDVGSPNQPESHDDPGDIDGAIQDLAAPQPQHAPGVAGGLGDGAVAHNWDGSPWCMHEKCFQAYIGVYGMSFSRAYSRNYKREIRSPISILGITKPLLVCKKMYIEAGESLYSTIAFSFPDMTVLDRFMNSVPQALRERIPAVDIMTYVIADGAGLSFEARGLSVHNASLPPLTTFCTKLKSVLSNVQEIRLCLHLTGSKSQDAPRQLPDKEWFEPLYRLSSELSQRRLRKMEVKLVTLCNMKSSCDQEGLLTYGSTPEFLKDAPFSAVLVPQGWHSDSDCCAYRVN
ncbi:hypothetical protein N0V93_004392 [Gnomoniopsis smithogilvyi]|uniref:Uncharacterized protein n=1 Tax=Gnomoniopsis smithogilvyi TaxID=1191159 RepID=A0A9W8YUQ8_9PEZI|nr:hypothetical protein N0V93_004392 [Gnomoniopsis smithogilvyi]